MKMTKIKEFFQNKLYLGLTIGGAVLLVAAILLMILLPGGSNTPEADLTGCTVEVKSVGGKALEGVGVYIYKDAAMTDMIDYVKTDAKGIAAISHPVPVGSVAVLDKVPEGYVAECLGHSVTAPNIDGQCAQFLFERLRYGTTSDDEVAYAAQCFPFFWHL